MIQIRTQSGVTRQIEAISLYSFNNMNTGHNMDHWRWHRMSELHSAVTSILSSKFGYTYGCNETSVPVSYESFSPKSLAWIRGQRQAKPFGWLSFIDDGALNRHANVWYDLDIRKCPFDDKFIYVPSGWGMSILKLAHNGIVGFVSFDSLHPEIVVGVRCDGSDANRFALKRILES